MTSGKIVPKDAGLPTARKESVSDLVADVRSLTVAAKKERSGRATGPDGRGKPLKVTFLVDATGSMYPVIEEVRSFIRELMQRISTRPGDVTFRIVAYRDLFDARVIEGSSWESDGSVLERFLSEVEADGGAGPMTQGDRGPEEAVEEGLAELVKSVTGRECQHHGILIGDQGPHHHPPKYIAESKKLGDLGVRVDTVWVKGGDTRPNDNWPKFAFSQIAELTRGKGPVELSDIDALADIATLSVANAAGDEEFVRDLSTNSKHALARGFGKQLLLGDGD